MAKKPIFVILISCLILGFALIPAQAVVLDDKPSQGQVATKDQKPELPKYAPGEIIIKFKSEDTALTADIINKAQKKAGFKLDKFDIEKIKALE